MLLSLCRGLASLKLAVILILFLAAVLAWATFLEADKGPELAHWYVYGSSWFVGGLALLGTNILAATLIRFPWKITQVGFVVTHVGLLVLLVGAMQTFRSGCEGTLSLREGREGDRFQVTDRSVITVLEPAQGKQRSTEFAFRPGPVDWPEQRPLDFGEADGLGLQVLKFYRHARENIDWVADDQDFQGPALKLRLSGPTGKAVAEDWLSAGLFGGEAVIGPTRYELLPLPMESMLDDLQPPSAEELGQAGILSMHCQGRMYRVKVEDHVGQKLPVGDSGVSVEIVEYLPNARPTPDGHFVSKGDTPKNPLLELRVYEPGRAEPTRQIVFAQRPLLNLDGVHGRELPVKFWYHHPVLSPIPGAVFLQLPSGKLFCRAAVGGAYTPTREVKVGDQIVLGGQFSVALAQYLPRARKELTFQPLERTAAEAADAEAAVLVELTVDGQRRQAWLKRGEPQSGVQSVLTGRGPIDLLFGYEAVPLGCTIQLQEFTRRPNPGGVGNAFFASTVRVREPAQGLDEERQISLNEPLTVGSFTFYQSSFEDSPNKGKVSVLAVAYDPGRRLKYLGSLMICAGTLLMLLVLPRQEVSHVGRLSEAVRTASESRPT